MDEPRPQKMHSPNFCTKTKDIAIKYNIDHDHFLPLSPGLDPAGEGRGESRKFLTGGKEGQGGYGGGRKGSDPLPPPRGKTPDKALIIANPQSIIGTEMDNLLKGNGTKPIWGKGRMIDRNLQLN